MFAHQSSPFSCNEPTVFASQFPLVQVQSQAIRCHTAILNEPHSATIYPPRTYQPMLIASISAGFEKGDFLVREEKGLNVCKLA